MSEKPRRSLTHWAVVLGVAAIGLLGGLAYSLIEVWRADRALAWPAANGTIVESRSPWSCGRTPTGRRTIVRYRYEVGGTSHESLRVLYGASSCYSLSAAMALEKQFPVAAAVKVAYDPQAPGEAVLLPGKVDESTWTGIAVLSLWLFIVMFAMGMVGIVARSASRRDPKLPAQRPLGSG